MLIMEFIIDNWFLIAIISLTFIIGVLAGIKVAKIKIILKILKKIDPEEFEKLIEEENEDRGDSPFSVGRLHQHTKGATNQYQIPSRK